MHAINMTLKKTALLVLAGALAFSCDRHRNMPGWDFMPDMIYSQAFETYTENPVFADSMTQRIPVYGTIPQDMAAFRYDVLPENRLLAGQTLLSPEQMAMKHVFEGKKLFTTFCANCHGESGKGDGYLVTSGKLPVKVGDLTEERLVTAARGDMFHVITVGSGLMGSYGAILSERDRWKIVEYVKVKIQGQELGARTLGGANPALSEPYEEFEARIAREFARTSGLGPVTSLQLGALNQSMVTEGAELFRAKCSSCHKPTKKYVGPAPVGILERRDPAWIMNMILNPEEMVSSDPVGKELLKRYLAPMANQNLTEDEARKIVEYFRTLEK
ncbi:MAG TPA: c-type cytochrome [Bacteroides sp.]|nr:c-type cytochrome [Bacteroides sp.]